MATTDRPTAEPDAAASDVAAALGDAELAQFVAVADGDALAAAGLLANACAAMGCPYHVSVVRTRAALEDRLGGADASATSVVLGTGHGDALSVDPDGPVSPLAYRIAAAIGGDPDPVTALVGVVAGGEVPSQLTPELLEAASLDREPGVATPTADLADGLAHAGLVHSTFSGDRDAARDALDGLGLDGADATAIEADDARHVASLVALAATGDDATVRAARSVERALRPHRTDGPFRTLEGYADVLGALAERAPGLAAAMTIGGGRDAALEAWRAHGRAAHAAVRTATLARYGGLVVARTDGPVAAVARLLRDFRAEEPVVLAVADGEAAAASIETPVSGPLADAAEAAGGSSLSRGRAGFARFDPDRTERFVEAFREAR